MPFLSFFLRLSFSSFLLFVLSLPLFRVLFLILAFLPFFLFLGGSGGFHLNFFFISCAAEFHHSTGTRGFPIQGCSVIDPKAVVQTCGLAEFPIATPSGWRTPRLHLGRCTVQGPRWVVPRISLTQTPTSRKTPSRVLPWWFPKRFEFRVALFLPTLFSVLRCPLSLFPSPCLNSVVCIFLVSPLSFFHFPGRHCCCGVQVPVKRPVFQNKSDTFGKMPEYMSDPYMDDPLKSEFVLGDSTFLCLECGNVGLCCLLSL